MTTTETHPFDAELARQYRWPVRTKDGQSVQIFQFDARSVSGFSLLGVIREEREDQVNKWLPNGRYFINDEDGRDLLLSTDYSNSLVREALQRAWKAGLPLKFSATENKATCGWVNLEPQHFEYGLRWDGFDYRLAQHLPTPPWSLGRTVNGHTLPSGAEWHRQDWTQEMLPEGTRPMMLGEVATGLDKIYFGKHWYIQDNPIQWRPCKDTEAHQRTTRPIPTAPALVPWTFEDAPDSLKVRSKKEGLLATAHCCPTGFVIFWSTTPEDYESHTFASLLANFTTLKGEPCGKEGK